MLYFGLVFQHIVIACAAHASPNIFRVYVKYVYGVELKHQHSLIATTRKRTQVLLHSCFTIYNHHSHSVSSHFSKSKWRERRSPIHFPFLTGTFHWICKQTHTHAQLPAHKYTQRAIHTDKRESMHTHTVTTTDQSTDTLPPNGLNMSRNIECSNIPELNKNDAVTQTK